MNEIIERFIKQQQYRSRNRSTAEHYMSDLRIVQRYLGDKPIEQVTVQDIDGFVASQSEQGLAATTINRRLATLQALFTYWASDAPDEARASPVNWRRHGLKQGRALPRDASDEVVDRLFAVMDDVRDRAIFGLMVGAGLRVGEVIALQLADLEAPTNPTAVARLRVCGKGEKERIVFLTAQWRTLLAAWLAVRPRTAESTLFLNQHQRSLTVDGVQFRLSQYCQAAGVRITCHQLRHTFARRLAEQRMPIESISQLLGHAQVITTQRYTNGANPDLRDQFLAAMASAASPAPLPAATVSNSPVCPQSTMSPPPAANPQQPTEAVDDRDKPTTTSPVTLVADRQELAAAISRFAGLPAWLHSTLADYLTERWRRWSAHMAATHAHRLARQLRRMWDTLLTQNRLTGWGDLRRSSLEAWLQTRAETGLAVSTQRNELCDLLAFLTFVNQRVTELPATLFQVAYPQARSPLPRFLPPEAFQRLWQTAIEQTQDHPLNRAWFLTLCHTGIRLSELLHLRLVDLDLHQGRLFIRGGKNGDDRLIFLTATLRQALTHYLKERPPSSLPSLWLEQGQPLKDHQIRHRLRRWGQIADVAVSPHCLRHTFATQLVNHGVSLDAVRRLLGHRTLHITQHYARLYDHTVKEQFTAAMSHIEGIATTDWPTVAAVSTESTFTVSVLTDSL